MTDDDKALVERLRDESIVGMPMENEAADLIEAQAAEIERLREALTQIRDMDVERSSEAWKRHSVKLKLIARAALGE